jgi:hypothetical protein
MDTLLEDASLVAAVGIGATAVMDAWLFALKAAGIPTLNFAFLGRWAGHLGRGRWRHEAIAKSPRIRGEAALGWLVHYAVGIAIAGVMAAVGGMAWMRSPSLLPALGVGIASVIAPLFVLQPAMGAGIASSRTPTPLKNCLRSLATHAVFGAGLYLSAAGVAAILP